MCPLLPWRTGGAIRGHHIFDVVGELLVLLKNIRFHVAQVCKYGLLQLPDVGIERLLFVLRPFEALLHLLFAYPEALFLVQKLLVWFGRLISVRHTWRPL